MPPRLLGLIAAAALACGRDVEPARPEGASIPPRTFAVVVTELATARVELLPDTAAYRARRDVILARHGVTAEELRAFVESYGGNEDIMSSIYRGIESRIEATNGSGATAPPSTGIAPDEVETVEPPAEAPGTAPDTTAADSRTLESVPDTTAAAAPDST